ncbi:MAG TPA: SOS response-associated peptidase [Chryseosolibacter sp.]|nr:SOS response-associated peptidase [Chryseosolibacter sp.]
MIERYSITANPGILSERFSLESADGYEAKYNAAPTHVLPVITSAAPQGLSFFYWGTSPEWSKNKTPAEKIINTRKEFFDDKPALKRALKRARCILPADGFYAWKKVGKKTAIPYRFVMHSKEMFSIAGMWEEYEDTEGDLIQTFTMITLPANSVVETVTERMPAILLKSDEEGWLNNDANEDELLALIKPVPENILNHYPVTPGISNITQNLPSMITATPPADQHGNLTLFD